MNRKKASWFYDRVVMYLVLFVLAFFVWFNTEMFSHVVNIRLEAYGDRLVFSIWVTLVLLGSLGCFGAILKLIAYEEELAPTTTAKSKNLEVVKLEYKEGSEFSRSYIRASWTATSIFLPVCFGLVAVSYSEPLLDLPYISLLPLAIASISLFLVWWLYTNRYAGYNRSIWRRLQDLEKQTEMYLHRKIDKDDRSRAVKWRIGHVNSLMLVLLLIAWIVRIAISPINA